MTTTPGAAHAPRPRWQRTLDRRRSRRGRPKLPLWAGLVVIAIGFAAIAIATSGRRNAGSTAPLATATTPDIDLEDGVITQFRNDGTLHYRLQAERIAHFEHGPGEPPGARPASLADEGGLPAAEQRATRLVAPSLVLHASDAPPWHLVARAGESRDTETALGAASEVTLRGDVVLRQRRDDGRFTELRTDELTLHLGRESAHADQTVMIATESSRSTAAGFRADLARGRFELRSSPSMRVSVAIEPPAADAPSGVDLRG